MSCTAARPGPTWARAGTITGHVLAVFGKAAWFGTSGEGLAVGTLWTTADGVHRHKYQYRCPAGYHLSGIAAASRSDVAFLCTDLLGTYHTDKAVLLSVNGGGTQHLTGVPE